MEAQHQRPEASNQIHEPLQAEMYRQREVLPDLLGHTSASVMRFLIPFFFIFLILFSFLSLEYSLMGGGRVQRQREDAMVWGMSGISDVKNT